jgi:LPXTG-site transpeptidase (sortase) family protein
MTTGRTKPFCFINAARTHWHTVLLLALLLVGLTGRPGYASDLPATLPVLGGGGTSDSASSNGFSLSIPGIGVDIPVEEALVRGDTWDFSPFTHQAAHLQLTALPGQGSNVVVGAHYELAGFQPGPFIHLDRLTIGDQITVEFQGRIYLYEVSQTRLVSPSDIEVVYGTPEETLTLLTCYGYAPHTGAYEQRFVVRAALVGIL